MGQEFKMHITVDARGIPCPRPRQMTIEAIRQANQGETVVVLVDRAAARDSVIRLVKAFQLPYKSVKKAKCYEIHVSREKLWMEK